MTVTQQVHFNFNNGGKSRFFYRLKMLKKDTTFVDMKW